MACALGCGRDRGVRGRHRRAPGPSRARFAASAGLDARSRSRDERSETATDSRTAMLRLVVAVLLLVSVGADPRVRRAFDGARAGPARAAVDRPAVHLDDYQVQLPEVGLYGDDYLHGSAKAQEVVERRARRRDVVRTSAPLDPSLLVVRALRAGDVPRVRRGAVRARAAGRNAARDDVPRLQHRRPRRRAPA